MKILYRKLSINDVIGLIKNKKILFFKKSTITERLY